MVKDCFIAHICANFGAARTFWRTSLFSARRSNPEQNPSAQYEHCIGTIPKKMPTKNELKRGSSEYFCRCQITRGIGLSGGTVISAPS